jgi:hypothetical protein
MTLLDGLIGVNVPMASAVLTLIDPRRYGVIDVRVWRLLYRLGSVKKRPRGVGLSFNEWYHYLIKLRYYAKKHNLPVRAVERTLFEYAKTIQRRAYVKGRASG